jgi:lactoylglutathione lyase
MSERPTRIHGVHTVGVPVTDQDGALAFYLDTLGFETRRDVPMGDNGRWIEVAPPGAPTTIALVPTSTGVPAGRPTGIRLATSDAEADHADLTPRGVDAGNLLRWPGVPPMFEFRDPDGNGLVVVEG